MSDSGIQSRLARMLASKPAWWHRNQEPKTKGIMLRCSESQLAMLQRAAEEDELSQQKVMERLVWPALEERFGGVFSQPQDDEAERERRAAKAKAAYQAAVAELFRLLELPAAEKGPDHRALLMAANDECGTTRTAMLAAWEGEEASWQR